jgi:hypothetical protein
MSRIGVNLREVSSLSLYPILAYLILFLPTSLSFAHNDSIMIIPIARDPINLDGILTNQEWSDAYQQNFTSAGVYGQFNILYLKYDFSEGAIAGAFSISDDTPSTIKEKTDQVSFQFDTMHDATESFGSDDHVIVITRDLRVEHYIGGDPMSPDQLKSIANSTIEHRTMNLLNPFSQIDFIVVNSSKTSWTAEFKIYFTNEFTQSYGFAMQQLDFRPSQSEVTAVDVVPVNSHFVPATVLDSDGDRRRTNFPLLNRTLAGIPSTWGDIRLAEDLHQVLENIRNICPSPSLPVGSNILCISASPPNQIYENQPASIPVSGRFANYINNSGIDNEKIHINIVNPSNEHQPAWEGDSESEDITTPDGRFSHQLDGVSLPKGNYLVKVEATSPQYRGISATTQFVVNERPFTIEQASGYIQLLIGIVGAGTALVVGFPTIYKHAAHRKRKSIFYEQMNQTNDLYYSRSSAENKEFILTNLRQKRIEVLDLLARGKIDEDQYKMLDNKISDYEQRVGTENSS